MHKANQWTNLFYCHRQWLSFWNFCLSSSSLSSLLFFGVWTEKFTPFYMFNTSRWAGVGNGGMKRGGREKRVWERKEESDCLSLWMNWKQRAMRFHPMMIKITLGTKYFCSFALLCFHSGIHLKLCQTIICLCVREEDMCGEEKKGKEREIGRSGKEINEIAKKRV